MYRKTFVCLCRQTICRIHTIFNTVHAMSDMNNIYQFHDIWRIFTRVRARTDRQTNRMHKHFSTLLESVKKGTHKTIKTNHKQYSHIIKFHPTVWDSVIFKTSECLVHRNLHKWISWIFLRAQKIIILQFLKI